MKARRSQLNAQSVAIKVTGRMSRDREGITIDAIDSTKSFLQSLNIVEHDWGSWVTELKQCDMETQDLLHEIELTKFEVQRGYKLCKKLQEVRQRRRKLKEKLEIFGALKDFLDSNKQLKISLFKTLTSMEKSEEHQLQRQYYPRVRDDLTLSEKRG